tara:strand:- start:545 stop:1066 length:522 start_codon:yes stop_codon:yes gene_type:complete
MNTVIGVGNVLLSDDGIGVHAVRALQALWGERSDTTFIDAGTLSYELLDWVSGSEYTLIIDAAYMQSLPGTVAVFYDEDIESQFSAAPSRTVHQISLRDTLKTSKIMFGRPKQCALIGVEPEFLSWGASPSKVVKLSLPKIIDSAYHILSRWGIPITKPENLSEFLMEDSNDP